MFERIIETEEYREGHYREKTAPRGRRAHPSPDQLADRLESYFSTLYGVTKYDCLAAVATVGLVARLLMLLCYFLTRHVVEYDITIGAWGLIGKLFWIWFDCTVIKGWQRYLRPVCLGYCSQTKKRPVAIGVAVLTGGITGLTLYQAVFEGHLRRFFLVNKLVVMGSIGVGLFLLLYYITRIAAIFSELEDDELLPSALKEMLHRNSHS